MIVSVGKEERNKSNVFHIKPIHRHAFNNSMIVLTILDLWSPTQWATMATGFFDQWLWWQMIFS